MPITDPWGITYSPRDMLFEGPRRTMGIFHWPMGVAFEGPSRTMGVLHWPLGVELQSPVIELPKNRTLDRTRTSPCRTAVQSSQNLRAKNRKNRSKRTGLDRFFAQPHM
jgi:hypothetical protein